MKRGRNDAQISLDFSAGSLASAQDGMERSWEHADEGWKDQALRCIEYVATRLQQLTTDEVHDILDQCTGAETHDLSALGPAMKEARHAGWIEKTGVVRRSRRASSHGRYIQVWRSGICQKEVPS